MRAYIFSRESSSATGYVLRRKDYTALLVLAIHRLRLDCVSHLVRKEEKHTTQENEERVPRLELGALVSCKDSRVTYCFVKCRSPI